MFKGLGQLGDMAKLMKQAQEMQQKMLDAQSELDNIEVLGEAGGGLVKVVATAKGNFKNIVVMIAIIEDINKKTKMILSKKFLARKVESIFYKI